jgi:DNA-binding CsgD family transcriptional regulator
MMIVCPVRSEERMVMRTDTLADAVEAVGTPAYAKACFRVLEESFDVDHWALFHYGPADAVRCSATASRANEIAAEQNIDRFVTRCHRFDPALNTFRQRLRGNPCLIKMGIGDIYDPQYRRCFEATHVEERLSFFAEIGAELVQLCIYRSSVPRTFSSVEMRLFATLARLIIATAAKHELLGESPPKPLRNMDVDTIERRLDCLPARLSKREREVCARAVLGRTIVETARDLDIERTSVITYRQRAYQKLKITRQASLLALVYDVSSDFGYRSEYPVE